MTVDEAVRGHVPPAWFWALPGIDRIRTFDQSQLPSPPSPVYWEYGRAMWVSMLADTAATGVAMTTLTPGLDVEPVSLALNYFRPVYTPANASCKGAR